LQNNNLYFTTLAYIFLHVSTYLAHRQVTAITKTFDACGNNPLSEDDLNEGIQNDKSGNKTNRQDKVQE
jgi:hypothetical protein